MSAAAPARPPVYGLMAEFGDPQSLIDAATRTRAAGYKRFDAYTPFPIEDLFEAMHYHRNEMPLLVLLAGIVGCVGGFTLAYWTSVISYPLNIAGKPLNSWPAFIPVVFECTILLAGLTAVFGMLALNGFPQPYHPVFNVPRFAHASRDGFFLCIEASDPKFDLDETRRFLDGMHPYQVSAVDH